MEKKDYTIKTVATNSADSTTKRTLLKSEIQNAEDYLYGDRDAAVLRLSHLKSKQNMDEIVPLLKQDLLSYVSYHHEDFQGQTYIKTPVYDLVTNFKFSDFAARGWKFEPHMLSQDAIDELQASIKNPIYVRRYNYERPIYDFANSITFTDTKEQHKDSGEQVKTDVQFYLTQKEDIMCAKVINLKYKPKSLRYFPGQVEPNEEDRKELLDDGFLYDRSLSISMYVLLDGDPKKAMPFMRYDNDPYPHTNVWIGHDKRKAVFGEVAESPHFHFQSEQDGLLCLRKFKRDGGSGKYRTGRCNAIDCKHLKAYLSRLDRFNGKMLANENRENGTNGMPFMDMKLNGHVIEINVDKIIENYLKTKSQMENVFLRDIKLYLDRTKDFPEYEMKKGRCFGKLIRALDFLDYISSKGRIELLADERKLMSEMELLVANAVMDGINRNNSNYLVQNNQPKYEIDYEFDRDIENE